MSSITEAPVIPRFPSVGCLADVRDAVGAARLSMHTKFVEAGACLDRVCDELDQATMNPDLISASPELLEVSKEALLARVEELAVMVSATDELFEDLKLSVQLAAEARDQDGSQHTLSSVLQGIIGQDAYEDATDEPFCFDEYTELPEEDRDQDSPDISSGVLEVMAGQDAFEAVEQEQPRTLSPYLVA